MADAVTTQTLVDGPKLAVVKITNISDGTGETAVTKITAANLNPPATSLKICRIWSDCAGMSVNLLFDATADVPAYILGAGNHGYLDFRSFGGLANNAGAGKTGNINVSTIGATLNDTYSIVLEVSKS